MMHDLDGYALFSVFTPKNTKVICALPVPSSEISLETSC